MVFEKEVRSLRKLADLHQERFAELISADQGKFYPLDLLVFGALNRSYYILTGFLGMIEKRNFVAAAPLVRMQLDNALRLFAAWLVENPHDFALAVLKGKRISSLRDKDNNRLTDAYLVEQLAKKHDWIPELYARASGFVHLSEKHIFAAITETFEDGEDKGFHIEFPNTTIREEAYSEALEAMYATTKLFFEYVVGWTITKDNPQLVERARTAAGQNQ